MNPVLIMIAIGSVVAIEQRDVPESMVYNLFDDFWKTVKQNKVLSVLIVFALGVIAKWFDSLYKKSTELIERGMCCCCCGPNWARCVQHWKAYDIAKILRWMQPRKPSRTPCEHTMELRPMSAQSTTTTSTQTAGPPREPQHTTKVEEH
ncbi:unnamed protein product, partial [Mesorhabditis spiculigera]